MEKTTDGLSFFCFSNQKIRQSIRLVSPLSMALYTPVAPGSFLERTPFFLTFVHPFLLKQPDGQETVRESEKDSKREGPGN